MIGTVEQLERKIHTVSGGLAADPDLLAELLAAASDRLSKLRRDRTLEPVPADPDDDPVARRFTLRNRIVQVPDLRSLESATIDYGRGDSSAAVELDVETLELVRPQGDEDAPAWWVELPASYSSAGLDPSCKRYLTLTGFWGPLDPEPAVLEAVLVWAARGYHERAGRYADAVQDPSGGSAAYFRQVPADVLGTVNALQIPGL